MTRRDKTNCRIVLSAEEARELKPTSNAKCKVTDAELIEALEAAEGEPAGAQIYLEEEMGIKIHINTIYTRIRESKPMQLICDTSDKTTTSRSKWNVKKEVRAGNFAASTWWLSHSKQGKAEGFGTKIENEISNPPGEAFKTEEEIVHSMKPEALDDLAKIVTYGSNADSGVS